MIINNVKTPPIDLQLCDEDVIPNLKPSHIVESFQTPLHGSYNWDYKAHDDRIKRLYSLGKKLNWDVELDVDWSQPNPGVTDFMYTFENARWENHKVYKTWNKEKRLAFINDMISWYNSQFLHGEQASLLVSSQLCSCAPTYNGKLYAASQAFDEARHLEAFNKYIHTRLHKIWPINPHLKGLLDKILTDPRWDLKFLGMQVIIEGLALSAYNIAKQVIQDPAYTQMIDLILRDEARHVAFGVTYLKEYIESLSEEEQYERAEFALEACRISRKNLKPFGLWEHYGLGIEYTEEFQMDPPHWIQATFEDTLFTKIMPNLKRVGLLRDEFIPEYEKLGLMKYADESLDYEISWEELSKPLT